MISKPKNPLNNFRFQILDFIEQITLTPYLPQNNQLVCATGNQASATQRCNTLKRKLNQLANIFITKTDRII